jgi:hypothetical protein
VYSYSSIATFRPKQLGGLGVLDWNQWTHQVPCSEVDKQLFRASTVVVVGNAAQASLWDSPWLQGLAPGNIAPSLC